ncbi:hypothetical protein CJF31_00004160 [Rutstroemia sp. NJR-2017a BVV2]|nr:hypothetical protein CJF31_00004160 [Rutstroemia sp. NJR-2017a BVV2]
MPYTPPSHRSPAASTDNSPAVSRRSSYQSSPGQMHSHRPELPRSTSYLTRHRRTPSVKANGFQPTLDPTPPGTADSEKGHHDSTHTLSTSNSLRQSPPPVTDETQIPIGVVMSPPDSAQNSDEEDVGLRGRKLENLEELQAAIRVIEQHRESSPNRITAELQKIAQAITPVPTDQEKKEKPTAEHIETSPQTQRGKMGHNRSHTETVFLDLKSNNSSGPATPVTGSDDDLTDDESARARRKPQMLRKKSGELVRPALRPSSARRRPSSMPGTPTFSKAVHFDSHLEHVRHFLQVDRPLAVSAGSSPVESYESDNEFPFSHDDDSNPRGPPFEWEIVVSNFPTLTPARLAMPVRVERVFLSADNKNLVGTIAVANLSFHKLVVARFTLDYWKTTSEVVAEFNNDIRQPRHSDGYDRFNFNIKLADQANLEAKTMFFCVKYAVNGQEYWDNNNSTNFQVDFRKKAKPQKGKKGSQGASSRPVNSLPRSNKKSPPAASKKANPTFDDFASNDFDLKYMNMGNLKQPTVHFLGDSAGRLKGVKSAVSLTSDNFARKAPSTNGQAFGHRYDFGASLSAAINAANTALGDKSGITMKSSKPSGKTQPSKILDYDDPVSPLSMSAPKNFNKSAPTKTQPAVVTRTSGTDSPRPLGTEKPVLASQSYNELLDKYCFVRTNEHHWGDKEIS